MIYNNSPLVSICCLCYNHEPYIRDCLDGFMMQKANFTFEVLIHDDASTDKSAEIIREYELIYPDVIKPIYQTENQYSKGIGVSKTHQFPRAQGKYIAMCEGDDYWTDPYKLQKQVDFLEANEDYSMSFSNASVYNETEKKIMFNQPGVTENRTYTINDFLISNPCPTASVLFKKEYISSLPEWFSKSPFGDYTLYLIILSRSGKNAFYFNETMCVYRIHSGGVHGNAHLSNKGMIKAYKQHLFFWKVIKKYLFVNQYHSEINRTVTEDYKLIIDYSINDKNIWEALKYNTLLMFESKFKYLKYNTITYFRILKNLLKK